MENKQFGQWVWCGDNDREYRYCIQKLDAFNERDIVYDLIDAIEMQFGIRILQWQMSYQLNGTFFEVTGYCDKEDCDAVPLEKGEIEYLLTIAVEEMLQAEKDFIERNFDDIVSNLLQDDVTKEDFRDILQEELEKYDEYLAIEDDDED